MNDITAHSIDLIKILKINGFGEREGCVNKWQKYGDNYCLTIDWEEDRYQDFSYIHFTQSIGSKWHKIQHTDLSIFLRLVSQIIDLKGIE